MMHQNRVSDRISRRQLGLASDYLAQEIQRSVERTLTEQRVPNVTVTMVRHTTTPFQRIWIKTSRSMTDQDWPKVIKGLKQLIKLHPPRPVLANTQVLMGIAFFKAGDRPAAGKALEEAIGLEPNNQLANLFLGCVRMVTNDFERAIEPLERARAGGDNDTHVNFYLGYIYTELHRWSDAIKAYKAEIKLSKRSETYECLARVYYRLSIEDSIRREVHLHNAIDTYRQLTNVERNNLQAYNLIGYLHSLLEEFREAAAAYERCLQIKPDYTLAMANLGSAYLNIGKDYEAKEVLERLVKLGEKTMRQQMIQASSSQNLDLNLRISMGQVYQALGAASLRIYLSEIQSKTKKANRSLLSTAESSFNTALEYNPQDVHALHNLGNVHRLRNLWAKAARFYSRVIELEPVNEDAAQNLQTIQEFRTEQRRWLEAKVSRRAQESTEANPMYTEDLIDVINEAREKLFENVEVGSEEDSFSQDDMLSSLLPVAQWLEEAGSPEIRVDLAARLSKRGWLSEDRAAKLAGLEPKTFQGAAQVFKTYDEILNLFAQGPSPQEVASFHFSPRAQERSRYLLDRNETGELTAEEAAELDQLVELEHLMQMVKARAQTHVGIEQ